MELNSLHIKIEFTSKHNSIIS